jgi:hypothetical protein
MRSGVSFGSHLVQRGQFLALAATTASTLAPFGTVCAQTFAGTQMRQNVLMFGVADGG